MQSNRFKNSNFGVSFRNLRSKYQKKKRWLINCKLYLREKLFRGSPYMKIGFLNSPKIFLLIII